MKYFCVKCGHQILKKDLDDSLQVATCPSCEEIQDFFQLVKIDENMKTELALMPPEGSKIDSYRYSDSVLEIYIPRRGITAESVFMLAFSTFWLGFIAVWTLLAMQASILFAMFSIPFWTVGISMFYGVTKLSFEKQKLELNGRTLKITKTRLLNSKTEEFPLVDIDSIEMEKMASSKHFHTKPQKIISSRHKVPTVKYHKDRETFLENATEEEKQWAVSLLKEYMYKVQGTKF